MPRLDALRGVITATVTPFHQDGSLDEDGLRRYVETLVKTPGVTGVLCNGYSGEIDALTSEERSRVVRICAEAIRGRGILIAGVNAGSTAEAISLGLAAKDAGAQVIQVGSPFKNILRRGFIATEATVLEFFSALGRKVDLPMSIFQYPKWTGLTYPPEILAKLVKIENVVAVKEAVDLDTYQDDFEAVAGEATVFADHNGFTLFAMLELGADGTMVGISNVGTELWTKLFALVTAGDIAGGLELTKTRLLPLMNVLSRNLGQTGTSFVARVKEALVVLGQIESATVRQPEPGPSEAEKSAIRQALIAAGLM